jgi:hypothetical protein
VRKESWILRLMRRCRLLLRRPVGLCMRIEVYDSVGIQAE